MPTNYVENRITRLVGLVYFTQYADQGEQLGNETWDSRAIPETIKSCLVWKYPLFPNSLVTEIRSVFIKEGY